MPLAVTNLRSSSAKNIVKQIEKFCSSNGQVVSEDLAGFVMKTILVNPDNGFNTAVVNTSEEVERLIELSCDFLLGQQTLSLETIKMQVSFNVHFATRDQYISENMAIMRSRLDSLIKDIINIRPRTKEELQTLYEKIVHLLVFWTNLDPFKKLLCFKETKAALHSVFPEPELGTFLGLNNQDKRQQLEELRYIVSGIRLYNKDCKKGGKTIDMEPLYLQSSVHNTLEIVEEGLSTSGKNANESLAILEQITSELVLDDQWRQLVWDVSVNARQETVYLQSAKKELQKCLSEMGKLQYKFYEQLSNLHNTLQSRIAIPTNQVYPKFIQLAKIWRCLQQEVVIMNQLQNVVENVKLHSQKLKSVMEGEFIINIRKHVRIKTDKDRENEAIRLSDIPETGPYMRIEIVQVQQDQLHSNFFAFQGFCCMALIRHHLLIPGYPKLGIAKHKGRHFIFATGASIVKFAFSPDKFVEQVLQMARKFPELIQLLQLDSQIFPALSGKTGKSSFTTADKLDCGVQTILHPIKQHQDPTYEWNEWEMRKKAILLTNLQTKQTRSSQTLETHLRRENCSQACPMKDASSQTRVKIGINTRNTKHYIAGLQGYRKGKPRKFIHVDLTEAIEEF